jgi:hypothetical protein
MIMFGRVKMEFTTEAGTYSNHVYHVFRIPFIQKAFIIRGILPEGFTRIVKGSDAGEVVNRKIRDDLYGPGSRINSQHISAWSF